MTATGLLLGGLVAGLIGRIGRLSPQKILLSIVFGSLGCGVVHRLSMILLLPIPSGFTGEGLIGWLHTAIDLQWFFWWILFVSFIPLTVTFVLGFTRTFSPIVIGLCGGMGWGLLRLCWMDYSPAPPFTGSLWRVGLGVQGWLCLICALSTAGVQRLLDERGTIPT